MSGTKLCIDPEKGACVSQVEGLPEMQYDMSIFGQAIREGDDPGGDYS